MYRKKVIIVDPVHRLNRFLKKFSSVHYFPDINYKKLSIIINKYNIIILRSGLTLDKSIIQKAKSLNIIARAGVGMDNIDIEESKRKKIKCFNVPSQSNLSVAEHALGLIFSASRKISLCDKLLRKNIWKKKEMYGFELSNKKLGIIGLGNIGMNIANLGKKFKMKIYASVNNFKQKRKNKLKKKNIFLHHNFLLKIRFYNNSVPLHENCKFKLKKHETIKKDCIIVNV